MHITFSEIDFSIRSIKFPEFKQLLSELNGKEIGVIFDSYNPYYLTIEDVKTTGVYLKRFSLRNDKERRFALQSLKGLMNRFFK